MRRPHASRWWPSGADAGVLALLGAGLAALYLPTYWDLAQTIWATDEQGHGPIILAVSLWMMYRRKEELAAMSSRPAPLAGWTLMLTGLVLYVFGRTQSIILFEVGSQIVVFSGLLLLFKGRAALWLMAFPLFFLIFMIPLPGALVAAVTTPLKSAVSGVAGDVLYKLGYPVGRTGVVLTIGQFQLLVADACAGLNSMFTLEALGLLYMNLMNYKSIARNVALAIVIVPISFTANVARVIILVLVTFYFGDEAGQGFIHGFAGMVLFLIALTLMLFADKLIGSALRTKRASAA
jgi:exosortase B